MNLAALRHRLSESLLAIPAMFVVGALGLSVLTRELGESLARAPGADLLFRGSHETARTILSSIASATITLTALVFSITMLILQLTSSRYSPRLLRTFLKDRNSQLTLGVFVGTFTFALASLRTIAADESDSPGFSVSVAVLLALVTVFVFIQYIDHTAKQIRITAIMESIAKETRNAIEKVFPEEPEPAVARPLLDGPLVRTIAAPKPGILVDLSVARLVAAAARADAQIEVTAPIGRFIPEGAPLLRIRSLSDDGDVDLGSEITIQRERTIARDALYGLRQLVDIAERSLSPSTNDPTTAVQAIDEIHDLLRRVARRPFPTGQHLDDGGQLRLVVPQRTWEEFVDLSVDEILLYGSQSLQITSRLADMLDDLISIAPPDRRPPLQRKRDAVEQARRRVEALVRDPEVTATR